MQEMRVQSLGWEDSPEKGMATHSSVLAWEIPWTEEPDRLQSMGVLKSYTGQASDGADIYQVIRVPAHRTADTKCFGLLLRKYNSTDCSRVQATLSLVRT